MGGGQIYSGWRKVTREARLKALLQPARVATRPSPFKA